MTSRTWMLFSHICNNEHMTGAEKLLLFILQEMKHRQQQLDSDKIEENGLSSGHRVLLVVPNDGLLARQARELGIDVIVEPYEPLWKIWDPDPSLYEDEAQRSNPEALRSLMNLMHMHRPDTVVVHSCVNALPAMAASRLGIPVLWMITEVMRDGPYTLQSVSLIDRYSSWIVGISEAALAPFRRVGLGAKTMLLPPSWHPDKIKPDTWSTHRDQLRASIGTEKDDLIVGYVVSDYAPHKGFDHFIDMALRLCAMYPHVRFLMVGTVSDPAYYDSCIQHIHQSAYPSRFCILPYNRSIEEIYPALDLVVVPSLVQEGFGLTAMEGMIFGKPVVAYRSGGLEEMLSVTGASDLLVPQGDIMALTATVGSIVNDRRRCLALGRSMQQKVFDVYGIEAYRLKLNHLMQMVEPGVVGVDQQLSSVRDTYAEGSLLTGEHTPAVFLIEQRKKRPFVNEAAFIQYGGRWEHVVTVKDSTLQAFSTGEAIR